MSAFTHLALASRPPEVRERRVDKTGQELLTSRSLFLLIRLAVGDAEECGWGTDLKSFKLVYGVNEQDLEPLVKAGWVGERESRPRSAGGKRSKSIYITDTGNEMVRGLVDWMKFKAEAGKEVAA